MTKEEIISRLQEDVSLNVDIEMSFTSTKGHEEPMDLSIYAGVKRAPNGETTVFYETGNPDCEIDGFNVKESVEEVKEIVKAAREMVNHAYKKYVIVEKDGKS